jgi:imidazolonepropionase
MGGAAALGLQHEVGSLEPGKSCDLLVLDSATHQELPYHWGVNLVTGVVAGGEVVVQDRQIVRTAPTSTTASAADGGPV